MNPENLAVQPTMTSTILQLWCKKKAMLLLQSHLP